MATSAPGTSTPDTSVPATEAPGTPAFPTAAETATYEDELGNETPADATPTISLTTAPTRTFQILKETHALPPALSFNILPTGGSAPSASPAYHTSRLSLLLHKPLLPPSFQIYAGSTTHGAKGLDEDTEGKEVAKVRFSGGIKNLEVEIGWSDWIETGRPVGTAMVKRVGWGRQYEFEIPSDGGKARRLVWKGTKSALSLAHEAEGSKEKSNSNGNLKLVAENEPAKVLALWENKTDPKLLGNLSIYDDLDERSGLEAVVMGCLGLVLSERVGYRGWFGGAGKKPKNSASESSPTAG